MSARPMSKRLPTDAIKVPRKRGHAMRSSSLKPAAELAKASGFCYPNESAEYRRAREALLAEVIELRRHIERVAGPRGQRPPGGEGDKHYAFEGDTGPA